MHYFPVTSFCCHVAFTNYIVFFYIYIYIFLFCMYPWYILYIYMPAGPGPGSTHTASSSFSSAPNNGFRERQRDSIRPSQGRRRGGGEKKKGTRPRRPTQWAPGRASSSALAAGSSRGCRQPSLTGQPPTLSMMLSAPPTALPARHPVSKGAVTSPWLASSLANRRYLARHPPLPHLVFDSSLSSSPSPPARGAFLCFKLCYADTARWLVGCLYVNAMTSTSRDCTQGHKEVFNTPPPPLRTWLGKGLLPTP